MKRRTTAQFAVLAVLGSLLIWFGQAPASAADMDCGDFSNQKNAQLFYLANGGPAVDPHNLDSDGDGIACESNPCPCYYGTSTPSTGGDGGTNTKDVLRQKARVIRVVDGDTIKVRLIPGGPRRTVRILGIDTPEVYGGTQCGGPAASQSMKKMLPRGTRVRMASDPTQAFKDRYDRLLRYVAKASTGRDVGRAQIWLGWAKVYVYNNNPFQRTASYRAAQSDAKAANRGIWKYC